MSGAATPSNSTRVPPEAVDKTDAAGVAENEDPITISGSAANAQSPELSGCARTIPRVANVRLAQPHGRSVECDEL